MISIFDIFKIGIGPSSSHTVGPMKAAAAFSDDLKQSELDAQTKRIVIDIYGSLALTGRGHGTFDALLLGLEGSLPHDIPLADIPDRLERIRTQHILRLNEREIRFNPDRDLNIRGDQVLPKHPNGLNFTAYGKDGGKLKEQIYYSVGGGFIVTDQEFDKQAEQTRPVPYPYTSCAELLAQCRMNQLDISEAVLANEAALAGCSEAEIRRLDALYPDYQFDIEAEQSALLAADIIVFQFPFSWYALPGLMKLWLDKVFLHGFSHGSKGRLGGKKLLLSFTTGAPAAVYQKDDAFGHTVEDYLPQFATTAALCSLDYQGAVYTNGVSYSARDDEAKINAQRELAENHGARLVAKLKELAA